MNNLNMSFHNSNTIEKQIYNDKVWITFQEGIRIDLNNLDYLNYLLQKSNKAIDEHNISAMKFVLWDLKEFKDHAKFFSYQLQAITEIKTLERLINLTKFKDYKRDIFISID